MKKFFSAPWIIALAVMMVFSLAGCSNPTSDEPGPIVDNGTDVKAAYTPSTAAAALMAPELKVDSAIQKGTAVNVKLSGILSVSYTEDGKSNMEAMSVGTAEEWLDADKKKAGFAVLVLRGVIPEDDEYAYFRVTEKNDSLGIYNGADTAYAEVGGVYTKKSAAPKWEESAPASSTTDEYIWSMLWADAATKTITYVVEYSTSGEDNSEPIATKTVTVDWSAVDLSATEITE